jgi:hypothetical protein
VPGVLKEHCGVGYHFLEEKIFNEGSEEKNKKTKREEKKKVEA